MSAPDIDPRRASKPPDPPRFMQAMAPEPGGLEQDLDECRTLTTLVSAVQALAKAPRHPSADLLVQALQQLARACRSRLLTVRAEPRRAREGAERNAWNPPALARAEALADQAEQVAQWARERVLGGDPGVLDQWLARQRQATTSPGCKSAAQAAAAPPNR